MNDRRGFTVIELVIGLVLAGVVVGSIFQFLVGQGRFVERQGAREEVQQNTRAALELIGSELRTLPAGDALVRAAADSITMRVPRVWGIVCAVPGAATLDVVFPSVDGTSWSTNLGTGVVVNFGTPAAPVWSNAVRLTSVGGAAAACGGSAVPAQAEARRLSLSATPQNGASTPAVGNVVYVYDQVTYRSGTSAGVPGEWIQRRIGDAAGSANQPMAGPIETGTGLQFQYFSGGSSAPLATPIADAATRASVDRVSVVVESVSRNSLGGDTESKADTVVVSLRNRMP